MVVVVVVVVVMVLWMVRAVAGATAVELDAGRGPGDLCSPWSSRIRVLARSVSCDDRQKENTTRLLGT